MATKTVLGVSRYFLKSIYSTASTLIEKYGDAMTPSWLRAYNDLAAAANTMDAMLARQKQPTHKFCINKHDTVVSCIKSKGVFPVTTKTATTKKATTTKPKTTTKTAAKSKTPVKTTKVATKNTSKTTAAKKIVTKTTTNKTTKNTTTNKKNTANATAKKTIKTKTAAKAR